MESDPSKSLDRKAIRERQLQQLGELAEYGLNMARYIEKSAMSPGADPAAVERAYARVCHEVRQTMLLQARILRGPP